MPFDLLQPDTRAKARQRQLKQEEDRDTSKKAVEFRIRKCSVHQKIRPKVHPHWSLVVVTRYRGIAIRSKLDTLFLLELDMSQELTLVG